MITGHESLHVLPMLWAVGGGMAELGVETEIPPKPVVKPAGGNISGLLSYDSVLVNKKYIRVREEESLPLYLRKGCPERCGPGDRRMARWRNRCIVDPQ